MRPFEALNQGGQVRRLRRLAEVALQAYPFHPTGGIYTRTSGKPLLSRQWAR